MLDYEPVSSHQAQGVVSGKWGPCPAGADHVLFESETIWVGTLEHPVPTATLGYRLWQQGARRERSCCGRGKKHLRLPVGSPPRTLPGTIIRAGPG